MFYPHRCSSFHWSYGSGCGIRSAGCRFCIAGYLAGWRKPFYHHWWAHSSSMFFQNRSCIQYALSIHSFRYCLGIAKYCSAKPVYFLWVQVCLPATLPVRSRYDRCLYCVSSILSILLHSVLSYKTTTIPHSVHKITQDCSRDNAVYRSSHHQQPSLALSIYCLPCGLSRCKHLCNLLLYHQTMPQSIPLAFLRWWMHAPAEMGLPYK